MGKRTSSPTPALIEPDYEERVTKKLRSMPPPDIAAMTLLALKSPSVLPVERRQRKRLPTDASEEAKSQTSDRRQAAEDPSVTDDEREPSAPPIAKALRCPRFPAQLLFPNLPTGKPLAAHPVLVSPSFEKNLKPISSKLM